MAATCSGSSEERRRTRQGLTALITSGGRVGQFMTTRGLCGDSQAYRLYYLLPYPLHWTNFPFSFVTQSASVSACRSACYVFLSLFVCLCLSATSSFLALSLSLSVTSACLCPVCLFVTSACLRPVCLFDTSACLRPVCLSGCLAGWLAG